MGQFFKKAFQGTTKAKGKRGDHNRLPCGEAYLRKLVYNHMRLAVKEGWSITITPEQWRTLVLARCFYCGREPYTIALPSLKCNGKLPVNGIDRRDNTQGYTPANSVSCCIECNRMKRDFTEARFIELCDDRVGYWCNDT